MRTSHPCARACSITALTAALALPRSTVYRILNTLNADGSVSVEDNGRGIPTGIHPEESTVGSDDLITDYLEGADDLLCLTPRWRSPARWLTRENGDTFRQRLLAVGGSVDPLDAFRAVRGRDADPGPARLDLLAQRFADALQRELAAAVGGHAGYGHEPAHGADVA